MISVKVFCCYLVQEIDLNNGSLIRHDFWTWISLNSDHQIGSNSSGTAISIIFPSCFVNDLRSNEKQMLDFISCPEVFVDLRRSTTRLVENKLREIAFSSIKNFERKKLDHFNIWKNCSWPFFFFSYILLFVIWFFDGQGRRASILYRWSTPR